MRFEEMFGAAEWVGYAAGDAPSLLFRAPFCTEKPLSATLTVVGLGVFEAFLNGRRVSEDLFLPLSTDYAPRSFKIGKGEDFGEVTAHRLYCPRYDVTALIEAGENVLAVLTGPGWFDMRWEQRYGAQRLVFSLELRYADGSVRTVVSSPDTVRVRPGFAVQATLHFGETHDYRGYSDAWMLPGIVSEEWTAAAALPPLETDYQTSDCAADRVIRHIRPVKTGGVWDCGENITGWPVLVCRAPAGEEITVRVSEAVTVAGELDPERCHWQVYRCISDGTPRVLHPRFTWFGFRYFTVEGKADVADVAVIHMDMPLTASFACDNETLNWLYDAYVRTQLDNMHMGLASDCPHLERRGYTGDGELTCDAVMTMFDARAFYRKWIGDISDCQDRLSGHVQYTAPYVESGGGPGGWGCAIVEVPYTYWKHTGDDAPLRALYPQMLRYFDYLDAHSEEGLVTSDRPGQWCLGDWCTPEEIAIPEPYVNTYFYIKSILRVLEIAPIVGRLADAARLEEKLRVLKRAVTARYYDAETGDFAKNVQGANAFAVDLGLGDARTYRNMAEHYRALGCYDTGIFATDIVTRLLFAHGDGDVAAALLASHTENGSYGHMQDLGATTLYEYWGAYARSYNHPMFGAAARYLFRYLLGIGQPEGACGWQRVTIRPVLVPQLTRAAGYVAVPAGRIAVSYEKRADSVFFTVTVPAGIDAEFSACGVRKKLGAGVASFTVLLA